MSLDALVAAAVDASSAMDADDESDPDATVSVASVDDRYAGLEPCPHCGVYFKVPLSHLRACGPVNQCPHCDVSMRSAPMFYKHVHNHLCAFCGSAFATETDRFRHELKECYRAVDVFRLESWPNCPYEDCNALIPGNVSSKYAQHMREHFCYRCGVLHTSMFHAIDHERVCKGK